ncbi:hypothetical protein SAMN05421771_4154 [Granulicella pectinivorans]|uniref:Uncharacterized protein n=1 Tax=Granulicella pectinivorans TaxID=474950 RepID=A0A1I6N057_9BACT|nr:hypothetical protein [Granulicella pectinivorans]SFS21345.1 hypothetical protein SAMN05421771_4154 [Granulicella pectinivorans]
MAAHTITIDEETFEAVRLEAERRNTSVEVVVAEYVRKGVSDSSDDDLWIPGVTRRQIYWERENRINRYSEQRQALEEFGDYAAEHPCHVDLKSFSREDLYERD